MFSNKIKKKKSGRKIFFRLKKIMMKIKYERKMKNAKKEKHNESILQKMNFENNKNEKSKLKLHWNKMIKT